MPGKKTSKKVKTPIEKLLDDAESDNNDTTTEVNDKDNELSEMAQSVFGINGKMEEEMRNLIVPKDQNGSTSHLNDETASHQHDDETVSQQSHHRDETTSHQQYEPPQAMFEFPKDNVPSITTLSLKIDDMSKVVDSMMKNMQTLTEVVQTLSKRPLVHIDGKTTKRVRITDVIEDDVPQKKMTFDSDDDNDGVGTKIIHKKRNFNSIKQRGRMSIKQRIIPNAGDRCKYIPESHARYCVKRRNAGERYCAQHKIAMKNERVVIAQTRLADELSELLDANALKEAGWIIPPGTNQPIDANEATNSDKETVDSDNDNEDIRDNVRENIHDNVRENIHDNVRENIHDNVRESV